jgi:methylase of polypeptide subunit release factors
MHSPGSGAITTYLAQILGNKAAYFAFDINPCVRHLNFVQSQSVNFRFSHACAATIKTFKHNLGPNYVLEVTRSDLLTGAKKLYGKVDVLIFNPPVRSISRLSCTHHVQQHAYLRHNGFTC